VLAASSHLRESTASSGQPESRMALVLLDQNAPRALRAILSGHDVRTALQMGWDALANGELISAAEISGFDVMVTADQNIVYQQNLTGRRLALVVLADNHWPVVRAAIQRVVDAVNNASVGSYQTIAFNRPALRRRRFNPSVDC
jgi:hypothetical protein